MTATQAPTHGPLSDAERYEQAKRDFNRMRDDGSLPDCDGCDASHRCMGVGNVCNPTAPVEASGSDREDDEPTEPEMQRAEVVSALLRYSFEGGAACDVADEIIGLLHPQPSGETREAVARIVDPETFALITHYSGIERFDGLTPEQRETDVFKGYPDLKSKRDAAYADADRILALLSARPLALRGQHSGGEGFAYVPLKGGAYPTDFIDALNGYITGGSGRCRESLESMGVLFGPTPARAEAQDEGAAGSVCASCFGSGKDAGSQFNACPDCGGKGRHPSPPPAADEDRVRIAVEALERAKAYRNGSGVLNYTLLWSDYDEALAALKSEGK